MKKQTYLNLILTVIAINLTLQTLQNFSMVRNVNASDKITNKSLLNTSGDFMPNNVVDVNIKSLNGYTLGNSIPISVKDWDTYDKVPVSVNGWQTNEMVNISVEEWDTYDEVRINVQNSPLRVKVED